MAAPRPPFEHCSRDPEWYVVRTKPKREDYAAQQLGRRGVLAFLPRVLEYGREQVAPLFPCYLFVRVVLPDQYYRVAWTPGIRSFVAFGLTPTPISESAVALIAASGDEMGIIRPLASLRPGDRVEIRSGPLAGLAAIIQRPCSRRGRVNILLDFLRQGASVELPVGLVHRL
jgi:transcriptional antiterminator RfaH